MAPQAAGVRVWEVMSLSSDLLVVTSGVPHRRRLAQQIYRRLLCLTVPIDVIVVTPEDVERYRDKVGPIIGSFMVPEARDTSVAARSPASGQD